MGYVYLTGEMILTKGNNERDQVTENPSKTVARAVVLLITAVVSIGFIYSMLYEGAIYESLFGDGGHFSDMKELTHGSNDSESDYSTTYKPGDNPSPTPNATEGEVTTTPEDTAEPTIKPIPTFSVLKDGDENSSVRELQTLLTQKGFYTGPITGYYGSMTRDAVKYFQGKKRLPQTGIVDGETMDALRASEDVM